MKKSCRQLLSVLLAGMLVCSAGIPRGYAQMVEGYTYTVIFYPGNQGRFASTEPLTVQSDTARVSFSGSRIRITGLRYGDRVGFDAAMDGAVILRDGSKYYSKGIRESGRDNSTVGTSSFAVTGDREYVVAYGIRGKMVSYRINYRDGNGKDLLPSRTYYGNIGERPVAAWAYVDGYLPQAYNLTRTLQADSEKNVFSFIYTATAARQNAASNARVSSQASPAPIADNAAPIHPVALIDLDETEAPSTEPESISNGTTGFAAAACATVCFVALGGLFLLMKKQRGTRDRKEYAENEE